MPYVMRNREGKVIAVSQYANSEQQWQSIDESDVELIQFMEASLALSSPFRESDIHLVRVLEDLITLLIDRNVIHFTDFPIAAQKRLLDRQSMRQKNQLDNILDDDNEDFL